MILTNYPFSPFLSSSGCDKLSSSTCTILEGLSEVGTSNARDVAGTGNIPLLDIASRMQIRLLSETRSVLEYLHQHLPTIRSHDSHGQRTAYSFPKIAVLRVNFQIGIYSRDRVELRPTGKCNRFCPISSMGCQWAGISWSAAERNASKVTHREYDDHQHRYDPTGS